MPEFKKLQSGEALRLADGRVIKLEHSLVYKEVGVAEDLFKDTVEKPFQSESIAGVRFRLINPVLLFAARYAHGRNTGAALAVVTALKACWPALTPEIRNQLLRESEEAQYNHEDWMELRNFAKTFKDS